MAYDQRCTACTHHAPLHNGKVLCGHNRSLFFGKAEPADLVRMVRSDWQAPRPCTLHSARPR